MSTNTPHLIAFWMILICEDQGEIQIRCRKKRMVHANDRTSILIWAAELRESPAPTPPNSQSHADSSMSTWAKFDTYKQMALEENTMFFWHWGKTKKMIQVRWD